MNLFNNSSIKLNYIFFSYCYRYRDYQGEKQTSSGGVSTSGSEDHSGSDDTRALLQSRKYNQHELPPLISQSQRDILRHQRNRSIGDNLQRSNIAKNISNGVLERGSIRELKQMRMNSRKLPCSPNQNHCPSRDSLLSEKSGGAEGIISRRGRTLIDSDQSFHISPCKGRVNGNRPQSCEEETDSANEWNLVDNQGNSVTKDCRQTFTEPSTQQNGFALKTKDSAGNRTKSHSTGKERVSMSKVNGVRTASDKHMVFNHPLQHAANGHNLVTQNSYTKNCNSPDVNARNSIHANTRHDINIAGKSPTRIRHEVSVAGKSSQDLVIQAEFHQENGAEYVSLKKYPSIRSVTCHASDVKLIPSSTSAVYKNRKPSSYSDSNSPVSPKDPDAFLWEYGDSDSDDGYTRPPDTWPDINGQSLSSPVRPPSTHSSHYLGDTGCKIVMPNGDQLHVNYDQVHELEREKFVIENGYVDSSTLNNVSNAGALNVQHSNLNNVVPHPLQKQERELSFKSSNHDYVNIGGDKTESVNSRRCQSMEINSSDYVNIPIDKSDIVISQPNLRRAEKVSMTRRNRSRTRKDGNGVSPGQFPSDTSVEKAGRAKTTRPSRRQRSASRSLSRSRIPLSSGSSTDEGPPSLVRPENNSSIRVSTSKKAVVVRNKRKAACPFDFLCDSLMVKVFSNLATDELCTVGRTCRRWYDLIWHPHLWNSIVIRDKRVNIDLALEVCNLDYYFLVLYFGNTFSHTVF